MSRSSIKVKVNIIKTSGHTSAAKARILRRFALHWMAILSCYWIVLYCIYIIWNHNQLHTPLLEPLPFFRPQDGLPTSLARPWTPKQPKLAQPDLDYIAPEIQLETSKIATVGCDVFSLGLLVCSVYNGGRSLVQSGYNPAVYMRHIDRVRRITISLSLTELHHHSSSVMSMAGIVARRHRKIAQKIPPITLTTGAVLDRISINY